MVQNRLYRSVKDRKIAGVAGGIAEYLEIDSAIVRLIWLLAILFGGAGFLAYLIAWIVIPEEKTFATGVNTIEKTPPAASDKDLAGGLNFLGVLLIILGVLFLLKAFIPFWLIRYFWPLVMIGFGILLLIPKK